MFFIKNLQGWIVFHTGRERNYRLGEIPSKAKQIQAPSKIKKVVKQKGMIDAFTNLPRV